VTRSAAGTHVGLKRKRNEDSHYLGKNLAVIADGMGGHVSGDTASRTVIDAVKAFDRPREPAMLAPTLSQMVYAANLTMRQHIKTDPSLAGMGTTLVGLMWSRGHFAVANVGDSRAYLLRGGRLKQITDDHVYARLVSNTSRVPHLNERISRFLDGRDDGRSPDLAPVPVRPGDRLMLCSDGLSSYVDHAVIGRAAGIADPQVAVEGLIQEALKAGAPDNVTVIVIDV
jgi:serine/threonine protein phosphatase PrpC